MVTWFTADLHLGHHRIREYEPATRGHFATVETMNDAIVAAHNALVAPTDTVYVLGDLALGDIAASLARAAELHGRKHLIAGNHERHSVEMRATGATLEHWRSTYRAHGFELLPDEIDIDLGAHRVLLSHYPYRGTHDADTTGRERHQQRRPLDHGLPLLHGHVHSLWRTRHRMFNVGIDANHLQPTPEADIAAWLQQLPPPHLPDRTLP